MALCSAIGVNAVVRCTLPVLHLYCASQRDACGSPPCTPCPSCRSQAGGGPLYESPTPGDLAPPLSERAKGAIASADQAVKEGTAEVLHAGAGLMGRIKVCGAGRGGADTLVASRALCTVLWTTAVLPCA